MAETIDWAPYANDGEVHRCMLPKGLPLSLTTDDIEGARYAPSIKTFLHPEEGSKMFPDGWLPQELYRRKRPSRRLITDRCINPLDPNYVIPEGPNLIPAGDQIFSNRITDLMDVSDIVGAKPKLLYKGPVRVRLEDILFDKKAHPAKWTRERLRCKVGTGLELFDINIGKKQFGFNRNPRSNPLEPLYPTEVEETAEQKFNRLKRKMMMPRKRLWQSGGEPVIDKLMEKLYWKSGQLPDACKHFDPNSTDRISYEDLRTSLEQFGVIYTDDEFRKLIPFADKEGEGCVPFLRFAKCLRWPSGLEKIVTKRIGQDQWEGIYGNLGQGLQVLLEETDRSGKRQMKEVEDAYHLVNVITGDPLLKKGTPLVPPREMLCLSYLEQLAEEENTKREMTFKSFMPADPPGLATKTLPILKPSVWKPPAEEKPSGDVKPPEDPALVSSVVTLPPVVPAPTIDAAAAAAAATAGPRKSVTLSPKKSVLAPPAENAPQAPVATEVPVGGEAAALPSGEPEDQVKLPILARKSMAPPGGFDSMPTFESMRQATRTKRLRLPSYSKRLNQERRQEEIQAVQYLA